MRGLAAMALAATILVATILAATVLATSAAAVLPSEQLADPRLEGRARAIGAALRCVVCQNQSIDDSDAPLAGDLRVILRERLLAGDSDRQATAYIVARYGHWVLLKPPFDGQTLLLWLGPALVLIAGGIAVGFYGRARSRDVEAAAPLTAEESEQLRRLTETDPAI